MRLCWNQNKVYYLGGRFSNATHALSLENYLVLELRAKTNHNIFPYPNQ